MLEKLTTGVFRESIIERIYGFFFRMDGAGGQTAIRPVRILNPIPINVIKAQVLFRRA
jgi:hypothetical protein